MRLAVVASHPVQYYAPVFRALATRCDLHVFYGQQLTAEQQGAAGFKAAFTWDVDLLSGYASTTLRNVSRTPGTESFADCDTPEVGTRLREGRFDCVLVMGWYLKCFWQAIWAAKRLAMPVMVRGDSHLETPRSTLKRVVKSSVYPVVLRVFDAALYVGERSRQYWEHYGYPSHRLFFSPHCIDNAWFAAHATVEARARTRGSLGIEPETFVVLFAGKLVPFKRPLDVIAAAAICRAKGRAVEVMVAGSGELDSDMRVRANLSGVPLHMLGFCNQTEMPPAYAAADVLVLPSDGRETWGLVANEALACGRPVIVSDACGCAPDLAANDHVGRVFPVGDVEAMADAVEQFLAGAPQFDAIEKVASKYSVDAAVDGVCQALESLLSSRRRAL